MTYFLNLWQRLPYYIDPVAFHLFRFPVRYYSLTYILAFLITYWLLKYRVKNEFRFYIYTSYVQDLMMFLALGVLFGGRIGYIILYNFEYYINNPMQVILPISFSKEGIHFTGFTGMSYHGGLLGSVVAALFFTNLKKFSFLTTADLIVPIVPLGYTFGRLGNFFNGELYGRPTSLPLGMYFPVTGSNILRHPSQLYESFFEGFIIFIIMWILKDKFFMNNLMFGVYLVLYGLVRFFIEYLRQPDANLGFVYLSFSMGQILCGLMVIIGSSLIVYTKMKEKGMQV